MATKIPEPKAHPSFVACVHFRPQSGRHFCTVCSMAVTLPNHEIGHNSNLKKMKMMNLGQKCLD